MEKNEEISEGNYDFGARCYDARIGRWWSVDAYASDFPSVSPYVGMGDSPIILVDPDGNRIRIHYMKGDIPDYFDYTPGMKLPDDADIFVQQVAESITHIMKYDPNKIFQQLHEEERTVHIYKTWGLASAARASKENQYFEGENLRLDVIIDWSSNTAHSDSKSLLGDSYIDEESSKFFGREITRIRTIPSGGSSPASTLLHEGGHALRILQIRTLADIKAYVRDMETYDQAYDNLEEKRVMTQIDVPYKNALNAAIDAGEFDGFKETIRDCHHCHGGSWLVANPTTIYPFNPSDKVSGVNYRRDTPIATIKAKQIPVTEKKIPVPRA